MRYGQRLIQRFASLNGISVALLMDSMLILYAIRNGVGDTGVAVLASFIHLTMPLMLVGKSMTARYGAARTWGIGWFLRNVFALLMVFAPFIPVGMPQSFRTGLILLGGLGFAAFRAVGLVGNSPLIGEITIDSDRGRYLSGNWIRGTISQLLSLVVVILILQSTPRIWVFQAVIGFGAILGLYVGSVLMRVPETESPRRSAQKPLGEIVRRVWSTPKLRRLTAAWAAGFAAFTMVIPFAIITLKNGYGLTDSQALLFTLVTLAGGTVASIVNSIVADEVGPRPLMILYVIALGGIAVFWAFAPERFLIIPTFFAFFVGGYSKYGLLVVTNHYFLNISDTGDRVGTGMLLRIISGTTAGLIGAVLGGGILGWLGTHGYEGISIYRTYFRIAAITFLGLIPIMVLTDKLAEWPLLRVCGLLFRPREIIKLRRR